MITGKDNKKLKNLSHLIKSREARRSQGLFVVEGIKMFREAPKAMIREIYASESFAAEHGDLLDKTGQYEVVAENKFASLSDTKTPQGIMLVMEMPRYSVRDLLYDRKFRWNSYHIKSPTGQDRTAAEGQILEGGRTQSEEKHQNSGGGRTQSGVELQNSGEGSTQIGEENQNSGDACYEEKHSGKAPLIIIAENLQDPGNAGTIIRTAEAAGVTGVIFTRGSVDVFNPKTIRATMGSIFRMPVMYGENIDEIVRAIKVGAAGIACAASGARAESTASPADVAQAESIAADGAQGIKIYATSLEAKTSCYHNEYTKGTAFIIGNESSGISDEAKAAADELIKIPMMGCSESLNAAMAAGILMYEAARQRLT